MPTRRPVDLPRPGRRRPAHDRRRARGPEFERHKQQHLVEQRGEDLRLAYVALTRAQHQAVVWWAGSWDSRHSALGRLLFARDDDGTVAAAGARTPTDSAVGRAARGARRGRARLHRRRARRRSALPVAWSGPRAASARRCRPSRFDRALDWRWRRTSYSDITAGAHDARVASEPEEAVVTDEPAPATLPAAAPDAGDAALRAVPSLLAEMPAGVHVGTFVHRVLRGGRLRRARPGRRARRAGRRDAGAPPRRRSATRAPSSPGCARRSRRRSARSLGGARLRDVARADRLDELDFELPLAGGDTPTGRLTLDAIAAVLRAHLRARRPARGLRRAARATRRCGDTRARLPDRQHRPRRAARRRVRDRRLQDELARARRGRS